MARQILQLQFCSHHSYKHLHIEVNWYRTVFLILQTETGFGFPISLYHSEQPEIPNRFSRQSCLGSRVLCTSLPHNRGIIVSVLIYKIEVDSLGSRMFLYCWDQSTINIIKTIWLCLAPRKRVMGCIQVRTLCSARSWMPCHFSCHLNSKPF